MLAFTGGWSWGQGYNLTGLTPVNGQLTGCDSTVTIDISAEMEDSLSNADFNLYLTGTNFTSSQFTTTIYWGDGSTSTHTGSVSSMGDAISWSPAISHQFGSYSSYPIYVEVYNPQTNSYGIDTLYYDLTMCNTDIYVSAQVDCDWDGNVDTTFSSGIPLTFTSSSHTYSGTSNGNMISIPSMATGNYQISVNQNWLLQHGWYLMQLNPSTLTVTPGSTVLTTLISLSCDTLGSSSSCISGVVYCDTDSNAVYNSGDVPLLNAPVVLMYNGFSQTVYTDANGYYSMTVYAAAGTPVAVMVNPNWLSVNGYGNIAGPQTVVSADCSNPAVVDVPISCNGSCSTTSCGGVFVFCDANGNGTMDNGEVPISNAPVTFTNYMQNILGVVYTDSSGYAQFCSNNIDTMFMLATVNSNWLVQHGYSATYSYITVPAEGPSVNYAGYFGINCGGSSTPCSDLWTTVTPWIGYYQGTTNYIKLNIGNYGPATGSTYTVTLTFPAGVTPVTSSINLPGYSISGNTITWNLTNAYAGYSYSDVIYFNVPGGLANGTAHYYTSTITATNNTTDCDSLNNYGGLLQLVGSSYDPNDKSVDHETALNPAVTETLTYVVRFQNTGTAPAQNIYIMDTLSTNLDWSTFEVLETSHPLQVIDMGNGVKRFDFQQIWLPDSTTNEPQSHGHIVYRVRENASNGIGSEIKNTAYIYFDWNDPVVTNTTYNINEVLSVATLAKETVRVFPNPASTAVSIQSDAAIQQVELVDLSGKVLFSQNVNTSQVTIPIEMYQAGMYVIRVVTSEGMLTTPLVKQ